MAQPTLLLKGSFDSFSIDDVLDVVGMSRQTMRVVLDDSGRGGEFLVKAGRVIAAAAPPAEGRRAFVNIYREPGQGFTVWQHADAVGEPIGLLADLIKEAQALEKAPAVPNRMPMLAGNFNDHRLDEVLDVLNMTRQLVEFKVIREDETRVTMILKAGQVLACEDERQSTSGLSAFRTLFADPGTHFEVVRLTTPPDDLPPPIGRLPALVQQALKEDAQAGKKRAGVLFQGAFKNFPLSDVLEALSVTRLTVEMVFHDSDGTRGTFVLKAGQVLAAQALRTGASGRLAFLELMTDPGESFVVVRRPGVPSGEPIGQLRELLSEARTRKSTIVPSVGGASTLRAAPSPGTQATEAVSAPRAVPPPPVAMAGKGRGPVTRAHTPVKSVPPPAPAVTAPSKPVVPKANPVPTIAAAKAAASTAKAATTPPSIEIVLDGTFDSFAIDDVLEVLGISRQYVALGTLRSGVPLARLVVKSGRLLMASYGSVKDPVEAMTLLLQDPGTEFRVRRLQRYADSDLGSLAEIVGKARKNKPPAPVLHLPRPPVPTPAPTPAPAPEIDSINLDDLFEDDAPPAPKAAPKPEPVVEVRAKERAKAKTQAKLDAESKVETKTPSRPEPKLAAKPEPKVAPKPEPAKVGAPKPEPRVAAKAEPAKVGAAKPEPAKVGTPKPEPRIAAKAQPKVAPKPEPKVASKPAPMVELETDPFEDLDLEPDPVKPEPKVAAKAEPKPEPKVAAKAVEPDLNLDDLDDLDREPEPKVAAKAEPESKPEPKPEPKSEPKVAAKAEPEPEPEPKVATKAEPEPTSEPKVAAKAEPEPEPTKAEPEPKVAARPAAESVVPPVAAAVDSPQTDAIVRSLALLEERLRTPAPTAGVGDETLAALTKSLEQMSKSMDGMVKETKSQAKTTRFFIGFVGLVLILGVGYLVMLMMNAPR